MAKILKPYTLLTGLYDNLMEYVDYQGWSEYLLDIIEDFEIDNESALELAAGNCKLYKFLKNAFDLHIVSDLSLPLLKEFTDESDHAICFDMRNIPLKRKFDFIYCTFDSINYLLTEEDLYKTFKSVHDLLEEDGIFTFDASLENNSINNVGELNREGIYKDYKYIQISRYDREAKLHTNEFIISGNGEKFVELHEQRVFDFVDYFRILEDAGLRVIDCFETFTFDDATPETERAQFIVEKF